MNSAGLSLHALKRDWLSAKRSVLDHSSPIARSKRIEKPLWYQRRGGMADRFDVGTTGLCGMLARGKHAFMCTGQNLWKNSGHETPLYYSMLAQSGKHATQPHQANTQC